MEEEMELLHQYFPAYDGLPVTFMEPLSKGCWNLNSLMKIARLLVICKLIITLLKE
jgi:hypothetical protein